MFESLLSPGKIGTLELRNRILMAPMGSNLCEPDGHLGERILRYYEERARGGAALLVVGSVGVSWPRGATNPNQVAFSNDSFVPGVAELARRVHSHGARLALQLHHGGRNAVNDMAAGRPIFVPSVPTFSGANDKATALSPEEADAISGMREGRLPVYEPASDATIGALIEDFASATERARSAGVDGVEVHAAHGYAIAGFLSPAWNSRTDDWGGSHENRVRLLCETLRAIRDRVGTDYPVWCRIDAQEFRVAGGIDLNDAIRTARAAEEAGADAIHVSAYSEGTSGIGFTEGPLVHAQGGYVDFARQIKQQLSIPVIAVGRIEADAADRLIDEGGADFVAMGRKLLADPELPRKLGEGRPEAVRPCIYCYRCVGEVCVGRSAFCGVNPLTGHEFERTLEATSRARKILVVGGGYSGLEAARVAALRGHDVTLVEMRDRLGDPSEGAEGADAAITALSRWLRNQVDALSVDVRLETEATVAWVESLRPDATIVAAGCRPLALDIPISKGACVLAPTELRTMRDVERRLGSDSGSFAKRRVVILGGGRRAISIADRLSGLGVTVTVLEPGDTVAAQLALPLRWRILHVLRERGVTLESRVQPQRVDVDSVSYVNRSGETISSPADAVVSALAHRPGFMAIDALRAVCPEVHEIGDCGGGDTIEDAIRSAFEVASRL